MIVNDSSYKNIGGFTDDDTREMRAFLLGAVHVWCRDRHGEWFAARDLLGGANFFWQGTPLIALYDHYLVESDGDSDYAMKQAGRAAGHLLKRVLIDDTKRRYETRQGYTREYRWLVKKCWGKNRFGGLVA